MSQGNREFNPFDPTGMWKEMRDSNMEAWAKTMVSVVNSEAYAQATGAMLDAWLRTSGPFQEVIEKAMAQTLAQLNMPTRDDLTRLAERFTNIEMRLDDLEAQLDELTPQLQASAEKKTKKSGKGGKNDE